MNLQLCRGYSITANTNNFCAMSTPRFLSHSNDGVYCTMHVRFHWRELLHVRTPRHLRPVRSMSERASQSPCVWPRLCVRAIPVACALAFCLRGLLVACCLLGSARVCARVVAFFFFFPLAWWFSFSVERDLLTDCWCLRACLCAARCSQAGLVRVQHVRLQQRLWRVRGVRGSVPCRAFAVCQEDVVVLLRLRRLWVQIDGASEECQWWRWQG